MGYPTESREGSCIRIGSAGFVLSGQSDKLEGYCFINDEYVPVPPMTQEQIDKAVHFILGLHNPAFEDEVIMSIIYEEVESFYQGQRTAEDVAEIIQNRVQLYLK